MTFAFYQTVVASKSGQKRSRPLVVAADTELILSPFLSNFLLSFFFSPTPDGHTST